MSTLSTPWMNYVSPWFALSPLQVVALTAYLENRGSNDGMHGVINVIQNRALYPVSAGYADPTIYEATGSIYYAVCLMRNQFSSYNLGDPNRGIALRLATPDAFMAELPVNPSLATAWAYCQNLASGTLTDITGGANHYFAVTISTPLWAYNMTKTAQFGGEKYFAAYPYLSQNPQLYIPPISNANSTIPTFTPTSPSGASSASTSNNEALSVVIPSAIINAI